ncbi:hypothetical protein jhhlp_008160 [Lomentospora prolificans]|uniref:Rhodopsin domain-containing protein n=1 Tax=Lomentospora prolificans TaxID=41688 RepID=A0A2N3MZN4_9PEZI|nr:hypothetical protein jhhlp_008160 [Lomentospora prolificans]
MAEPTTTVDVSQATPTTIVDDGLPHNHLIVEFNVIIWILTGISGLVLFLRGYCKITRQRGLWWDDWIMLAAWITIVISCVFGSISTTMGFGRHTYDIDTEGPGFPKLLLIMNMTGFWSIWGAAWSKTSFAVTLLRLTQTSALKWFIWFLIITVNVGLYIAAIFMWVQCDPPEKVWNPNVEGTCWDGNIIVAYNSWTAVWSGLADIALAVIPWWIISRAAMNFKEQLGLLLCMSLGVFAGCTSIAKVITMKAITSNDMRCRAVNTPPLNILGIAEAAVTIIAASVPVLRALIRAPNLSNVKSFSLSISNSKSNASQLQSQARREYEVLDKDSDNISTIKLTRLDRVNAEESHGSSPRAMGHPSRDEWRRY